MLSTRLQLPSRDRSGSRLALLPSLGLCLQSLVWSARLTLGVGNKGRARVGGLYEA